VNGRSRRVPRVPVDDHASQVAADVAGDARLQAGGFGAAADVYRHGRPGYPQALIGSIVPRAARRVLDLGAGTGKLTSLLVETGIEVVAVEPDAAMRAQLAAAVPGATIRAGTAERIPLPDGSVDAVVVAQAWHWFDASAAVPEIARVLTPGDTEPVPGPPFGDPERLDIRWRHTTTTAGIVDLVASRSYVITLSERERGRLLADVEHLLATHPGVRDREQIAMPYITRCTRVRRG
jgi:ubiquinone/menaquinone biosynthesis C-methylase UbiE